MECIGLLTTEQKLVTLTPKARFNELPIWGAGVTRPESRGITDCTWGGSSGRHPVGVNRVESLIIRDFRWAYEATVVHSPLSGHIYVYISRVYAYAYAYVPRGPHRHASFAFLRLFRVGLKVSLKPSKVQQYISIPVDASTPSFKIPESQPRKTCCPNSEELHNSALIVRMKEAIAEIRVDMSAAIRPASS